MVFDFAARRHLDSLLKMEDSKAPHVFIDGHNQTTTQEERQQRLKELIHIECFQEKISVHFPGGKIKKIVYTFRFTRAQAGQIRMEVKLPEETKRHFYQEMALAFCMGSHSRLGRSSLLNLLDANCVWTIFEQFILLLPIEECITTEDIRTCLIDLGEMQENN
mgnify:CR=1 FL=1|jgi:hypothetical protein